MLLAYTMYIIGCAFTGYTLGWILAKVMEKYGVLA
jgi:hypothetical protein